MVKLQAVRPFPKMYRSQQVAHMLGVSAQTVRRWFEGRQVPIVGTRQTTAKKRRYRVFLISEDDLQDWLNEHRG
jgi:hypothetical protein